MPVKGQRDPSKWATTECPTCGKTFEFLKSWPRKFCHNVCAGKANVANIKHFQPSGFTAICEQCGIAFEATPKKTRGRFCSRKCFGGWQSANVRGDAHPKKGRKLGRSKHLPPPVTKPCEVCGNEFQTKASHVERRRTCSKLCFGALLSTTIAGEQNFNWKGGYEPYYGPTWRRAQRAARERDKVCQDCGKTRSENGKALDVHHIQPFRTFGLERHSEANDLSNLVTLCPACHKRREPKAA